MPFIPPFPVARALRTPQVPSLPPHLPSSDSCTPAPTEQMTDLGDPAAHTEAEQPAQETSSVYESPPLRPGQLALPHEMGAEDDDISEALEILDQLFAATGAFRGASGVDELTAVGEGAPEAAEETQPAPSARGTLPESQVADETVTLSEIFAVATVDETNTPADTHVDVLAAPTPPPPRPVGDVTSRLADKVMALSSRVDHLEGTLRWLTNALAPVLNSIPGHPDCKGRLDSLETSMAAVREDVGLLLNAALPVRAPSPVDPIRRELDRHTTVLSGSDNGGRNPPQPLEGFTIVYPSGRQLEVRPASSYAEMKAAHRVDGPNDAVTKGMVEVTGVVGDGRRADPPAPTKLPSLPSTSRVEFVGENKSPEKKALETRVPAKRPPKRPTSRQDSPVTERPEHSQVDPPETAAEHTSKPQAALRKERKRHRAGQRQIPERLEGLLAMSDGRRPSGITQSVWPNFPKNWNTWRMLKQEVMCDSCNGSMHWPCAGLTLGDLTVPAPFHCPDCKYLIDNDRVDEILPGPAKRCARFDCCRRRKQRMEVDEKDEEEYFLKRVIGRRAVARIEGKRVFEYLVEWEGYKLEDSTWEPEKNIHQDKGGTRPHVEDFLHVAQKAGVNLKRRVAILPEADISRVFDPESGDKNGGERTGVKTSGDKVETRKRRRSRRDAPDDY